MYLDLTFGPTVETKYLRVWLTEELILQLFVKFEFRFKLEEDREDLDNEGVRRNKVI